MITLGRRKCLCIFWHDVRFIEEASKPSVVYARIADPCKVIMDTRNTPRRT